MSFISKTWLKSDLKHFNQNSADSANSPTASEGYLVLTLLTGTPKRFPASRASVDAFLPVARTGVRNAKRRSDWPRKCERNTAASVNSVIPRHEPSGGHIEPRIQKSVQCVLKPSRLQPKNVVTATISLRNEYITKRLPCTWSRGRSKHFSKVLPTWGLVG